MGWFTKGIVSTTITFNYGGVEYQVPVGGDNDGIVGVYEYSDNSWNQLSHTISLGFGEFSAAGSSISLVYTQNNEIFVNDKTILD